MAAIFALVVGACSGAGDEPSARGGDSGESRSEGVPDPDATLRYGIDLTAAFTGSFDPAKVRGCDRPILDLIYDRLVRRDADNQLVPGLAKSWEIGDNALTIQLKPNVKFSNGEAYDAEAVKAGLLHNKTNPLFGALQKVESIDVMGPLELRLNLVDNSGLRVLYGFTSTDSWIIAPAALETAGDKPVGAGPFVLERYAPNSRIVLRRNPKYFQPDRFKLGGVEFIQVGAGPPSVTAIRSQSVDLVRFLPESLGAVRRDPRLGTAIRKSGAYLQVQFRLSSKPLDDVRVRRAIAHAIDRKAINEVVLGGEGEVASQTFPKGHPAYVPEVADRYPYDPDRARQLLAQAGHKDGFDFEMVVPSGVALAERQSVIIQEQLKEVGIRATIRKALGSELASIYYIGRQGDALVAAATAQANPPIMLNPFFGKGQFAAISNGAENPQISDILSQALTTQDTDKMIDLVRQASRIVVDQALELPIAFVPQLVAYDKERVGGTVRAPFDFCEADDFSDVFVKKS